MSKELVRAAGFILFRRLQGIEFLLMQVTSLGQDILVGERFFYLTTTLKFLKSIEYTVSFRERSFRLEVERAWARARRPGPNFWLAVNKLWARKSPGLVLKSSTELFSGLEPRLEDKNWPKTIKNL